jgi:hypothetical protein
MHFFSESGTEKSVIVSNGMVRPDNDSHNVPSLMNSVLHYGVTLAVIFSSQYLDEIKHI